MCTLTELQQNISPQSNSKQREDASGASSLQARILNKQFLLRLAAEAEIYNIYGILINYAQIVDILPHERLDEIDASIKFFDEMGKYIDHDMCIQSNAQVCRWPKYHTALKSLADHGQIFGVNVIDDYPSRGGLGVNTTRSITYFLDKK